MEMTTLYNKYFGQAVKSVKERPKILVSQLVVLLCAFVLGHSSIFDNLSPFALSFLCAVPSSFSFSALAGACFGYMTKQSGIMLIRYIATAITLWVISNKIIGKFSKYNEIWFLFPLISTVVTFVLGLSVLIPKGISLNGIWIFLSESLLCGVSTYFLRKTFAIKNNSNRKVCLTHSELVCVIASIAILLMSLSFLQFKGIMLSRIIATIMVLVAGYYAKEAGGCIVGITASVSLCFTSDNPYAIFVFAFGGLLCGVFSSLGRIATAAAYIVANSILYIVAGGEINMAVLLLESIAGAFVFLIVPTKYMDKLQKYFHVTFKSFSNDIIKKDITGKLLTASKAVNEVSSNIIHISDGLKRINYNDEKSIYCYVREDICSRCPKEDFCWQDNFSTMIKNFDYYLHLFKEKEYVSENDVPNEIKNQCDKFSLLLASFKNNYARYISVCEEEKDINNLRNMLSDQLSCMSSVLKSFADDFEKEEVLDNETAGQVKQIFSDHYIDAMKIVCSVDSKGKMKIIAQCKKIERGIKKEILIKEIECLTLRKFEMPVINFSENGIMITIKQKPWMKLAVGSMQYPSEGNTLCGDFFEKISYDDGKETIIISDGMGTGGRAAVDAAMAAGYFGKLAKAGFDFESALKIVNSTLSVKSVYESLSTIDVVNVDLFTGQAEFFKAGAAISFVRKNGKCHIVESASLPTGILREVSFATDNFTVCSGDIIVLVSDGVTEYGTTWIANEIEKWKYDSPQKLSQKIASMATEKATDGKHDDITVVSLLVS